MINDVKFKDNNLYIGVNEYSYKYMIKNAIVIDNQVIVLLSIPNGENVINNLFSTAANGKINWMIQPVTEKFPNIEMPLPMEQMTFNGEKLFASDFYGRKFEIDITNGKLLNYTITK